MPLKKPASNKQNFNQLLKDMTFWRRELHAHPETAFEEVRTSDFIAGLLSEWGIEVHRGIGKTGLVGVLHGKGNGGKKIGLRADMDALNIQEANKFAHASRYKGKMHACGHDGHVAMLLGAAKHLAATRNFDGTVHFIFQPAEEGGGGGHVMVEEGLFERFPCDAVYALHNWPDMDVGTIGVCDNAMTASSDSFKITVTGRGGHAAYPQDSIDSIVVGSTIVMALHAMSSSNTDPLEGVVLTVCQFHGGTSDNIVPESIVLSGTIRCFNKETRVELEKSIKRISQSIALAYGAVATVEVMRGYPSVVNTREEVQLARKVASTVVGKENVHDFKPTMGSEDFSFMLQQRPGAYIALGQGAGSKSCKLHSPSYDFNDAALPIGARYWINLVEKSLPLQKRQPRANALKKKPPSQ